MQLKCLPVTQLRIHLGFICLSNKEILIHLIVEFLIMLKKKTQHQKLHKYFKVEWLNLLFDIFYCLLAWIPVASSSRYLRERETSESTER